MRPAGRQVLLDMVRSVASAPVRVRVWALARVREWGLVLERVQARTRAQV